MSGRWLAPTLLLGVAVVLLLLTWTTPRPVPLSPGDEPAQEREAQRRRIAQLEQETARLQVALAAVARRPERALALVVEADLEQDYVALVNADRIALARPPLALDPQLDWVATWRAADMAAKVYYSHTSPLGETAATVLAGFGGPNILVGENIWACASWQDCTPALIHQTFTASPGHRENQELPAYDHIGVGVVPDAAGRLLIAVLFSDQSGVAALASRS